MDERRLVSVLFCDEVGSTALAAQLDPEEWAEIIRAAFPHLIEPVERYGGTVARLMGDAILAFFGASDAREDDAQRAVLAGLAILDGIQPLRNEVQRDFGLDLNVRVGINTGYAIVGQFGTEQVSEYTAMGDAVNVAARMEQTAAPGTVQIASETYAHVHHHALVEALGPVEVRGKDEPVNAFRVTGWVAEPERRMGDLYAPLIGRSRELDVLKSALDSLRNGLGGIVAVTGAAGLGKSRLLDEFQREGSSATGCDSSAGWIKDQLTAYESGTPYGLIRRRICAGLELPDGAEPEEVLARVSEALAGLSFGERARAVRTINLLFSLGPEHGQRPGTSEPALPFGGDEFRRELVELVEFIWREWIAGCGAGVYVVDDFQHADTASLETLDALLEAVSDLPLLVTLAFRDEPGSASARFCQMLAERNHTRLTSVVLMPLDTDQAAALVDALLTGTDQPDGFREILLDRIDGNPLFAEEIVRSLIGQGLTVEHRAGQGMRLRLEPGADLARATIPTTLYALMQERMDRLPPAAKETLQVAAVLGRAFTHDQLAAVLGADREVDEHLATLGEAMLIRSDPPPAAEFSFYHALTWEAAYEGILLRQRRNLHRRVGETLELLHAANPVEQAAVQSYHFAVARDERAIRYATLAGRRALELYAQREAIAQFERAVEVAQQLRLDPPLDAVHGRGTAYLQQGDYERARIDFETGLNAARRVADSQVEWELLMLLGETWEGNDYARAGEWYTAADDHAAAIGNELLTARSLLRLGNWHVNTERVSEARAAVERALAIFERHEDQRGMAEALDQLATVADMSSDVEGMLTYFQQAATHFEALGDQLRLSSALTNIGQTWLLPAYFALTPPTGINEEQALAAAVRGLEIARAAGWRAGEAYSYVTFGAVHWIRGHFDLAMQNISRGLAIADEIQHQEWLAFGLGVKGWLHYALLDFHRAVKAVEQSVEHARAAGAPHFVNLGLAGLCDALTATGDLERAAAVLDALPESRAPETISERMVWRSRSLLRLAQGDAETGLRINTTLIETSPNQVGLASVPILATDRGAILIELGRYAEAREALEAALRGMDRYGVYVTSWQVHAALARLHRETGDLHAAAAAAMEAEQAIESLAGFMGDEAQRAAFLSRARLRLAAAGTRSAMS